MLPSAVTSLLKGNLGSLDKSALLCQARTCWRVRSPGEVIIEFGFRSGRVMPIDWERFIIEKPSIFAHFMVDRLVEDKSLIEFCGNPTNSELIVENLVSSGVLMEHVAEWGAFFDAPYPFAPALRQIAIENADREIVRRRYVGRVIKFRLALPAEAGLLPHILGAMLDAFDMPLPYRFESENLQPPRPQLSKWVGGYIPEQQSLQAIWEHDSVSKRTRAAALVLYMLHSESSHGDRLRLLFELYDDSNAPWLLPGIGYAIFDRIACGETAAVEGFGSLLERSAQNLFGRAALDPVLQAWREVPGSPVTSCGQKQLWQ